MLTLIPAMKTKFLWSTSQTSNRRHTFKEKTRADSVKEDFLKDKRCMSMPSVASSSPTASSSTVSSTHTPLSRMLRLQDRRFHQRFAKVNPDEQLVNYFSCALLQDRLLHQGNLYITDSYVAFYSNIFGHKKEILIQLSDVVKVTKEKTAKIIPNAVGIYTEKEKYIFGSLLSRDTAFRVIQQTWIRSTDPGLGLHEDSESEISPVLGLLCPGEEDSSVSSGMSGHMTSDEVSPGMSDASPLLSSTPEIMSITPSALVEQKRLPLNKTLKHTYSFRDRLARLEETIFSLSKLSRMTVLYVISIALIIMLLFSACILFYRIRLVHRRLPPPASWYLDNKKYSQAPSVIERDIEVELMLLKVQERARHISLIRHAINELLTTAVPELHPLNKRPAESGS